MKRDTADAERFGDLPKLAAPARRALANAEIHDLKELSKFSEKQIQALHGMGTNALEVLRRALAEKGWSFADSN